MPGCGRTVCVVTGGRADYGLLVPLLTRIAADPALRLKIVACGTHVSPAFGMTVREMEADGFPPDEIVEALVSADTPTAVCKSMGLSLIGFGDAYRRLSPDLVLVLGDRYEILAAATAALICRIPLAHIAGGQLTAGAVDDSIRHSITKMAALHFTAAEDYARRILQMGEEPGHVHVTGALGLDNVRTVPRLSRGELERDLGFSFGDLAVLATYHPETLDEEDGDAGLAAMLEALDARPGLRILFTLPNADAGSWALRQRIEAFAATRSGRCLAVASLGRRRYLSALACVDAMIGNSSSGLIEAPSFALPVVNIGDRQAGRIRAANILDCSPDGRAVTDALDRALSVKFRRSLHGLRNPLGDGHAAERITDILKTTPLEGLIRKRFNDMAFPFPSSRPPWSEP